MRRPSAGLAGRVALVTGAARGLGASIAARLAEEGAAVVLCDLDEPGAADAARRLEESGARALALRCDVGVAQDVERTVRTAVAELGSLDILVNNAGITRDNLIHKMSDADWDLVSLVHLKGAFLCARAAQRPMVERSWGRIVNLSSTSALGTRGQANYSAAKAGLQGFTRALALELGRFGITVNCVAPGFIDTEMTRLTARRLGKDPGAYMTERAAGIAVGRVGTPADVANAVAFFASEEASFVSGQVLYVSGGPETRRGG
ncbi:MAG: SDR family oxidoreductase [Burkholderiaceae bacterium]|nr:SDR family oxidoreductase [Burkholderiaceae bacterium]